VGELSDTELNESKRTDPLSFAVRAAAGLQNAFVPMAAAYFSLNDTQWGLLAAIGIGVLVVAASAGFAFISWRKLTYIVGAEDIRVESGVISRAARSVPYERIQDVSLEQKLLPRLFGLVSVKFETGAGGGEDLALNYLSEQEGERLREVIKARKDGSAIAVDGDTAETVTALPADVLFAIDQKRLFTFGMFEFSLAVFAVLAGLFQYAETFMSIELYDPGVWGEYFAGPGSWIATWGPAAQVFGALAGLLTLALVGSFTGLVRTFLRDWGFVLERTEKGFRRRRGLLTKTDVVMPVHRVQAVTVGTGFLRRRFGWFGLKFVSLAQDSGSASHDVAPFAKMTELAPIATAAGFATEPSEGTEWLRGSRKYRMDSGIIEFAIFAFVACGVAVGLSFTDKVSSLWALIAIGAGGLFALRQMFLWRFDYNALGANFLFIRRGWLAPKLEVASRIKLQSVEIAQGPISRRRGYAALKLGLAGGTLEVEGLPLERALKLRTAILDSIARTDFSEING